jgi:hypothetical protein
MIAALPARAAFGCDAVIAAQRMLFTSGGWMVLRFGEVVLI